MIPEAFLICALAVPATHHTRPRIIPWMMSEESEKKRIEDFIKKNNPDAEVFIHPEPQEELLKNHGWERVPFTWRGNKIWIKREPKRDQKHRRAIAESA